MNIGDHPRTADFNNKTFDPAIFQTLGGVIEHAEEGRSRVRFPFRPTFAIPGGFVQGGIQAAFVDEGMIVAVRTLLPASDHYTTSELRLTYLRPAGGEYFVCESEVVRKGRTVIYVEASLKDDQGRLVARASSSLVRVEGRYPANAPDGRADAP
jgi:uncharacterized protein (TIGR00369 family)